MKTIQIDGGGLFITFDHDRDKVKVMRILGAKFEPHSKHGKGWKLDEPNAVALFRDLPPSTLFEALVQKIKTLIDKSSGIEYDGPPLEVPPGKALLSHQASACRHIADREATLEADPMGAGKTIITSVAGYAVQALKVLIVCPATLKTNWWREWKSWNIDAREQRQTIAIASGSYWPNTDVVIVNYDIIDRFRNQYGVDEGGLFSKGSEGERVITHYGQIDNTEWDMVILDECHKIKGMKAIRTRAIVGAFSRGVEIQSPIRAKRRIGMSGTPLLNRPIELFPILHWLWPEAFPSHHLFGMKYCGAKRSKRGWDYKGNSNEAELNARLRILGMIRRPKSITHKDVPPKYRKIIELQVSNIDDRLAVEQDTFQQLERDEAELESAKIASRLLGDDGDWQAAMRELSSRIVAGAAQLEAVRLDVARAKLPYVIEYIKEELKERPKVVVFCWHKEICRAVAEAFENSAMINGDVPTDERQALIDKFQIDPKCTVFIGTIASCGAGITLTASDLILFIELHWVPGDMLQAEDRCHRKGQEKVLEVQYIVAESSIDSTMAVRIIDKMEVIEAVIGQADSIELSRRVSSTEEVEAAVIGPGMPNIEDMALRVKPSSMWSVRDKLGILARGRYVKRPTQIEQVFAGRLYQVKSWSLHQQAIAEMLVAKYGVMGDENFNGRKMEDVNNAALSDSQQGTSEAATEPTA